MAPVLGARIAEPEQLDPAELDSYDLVGFGSGIFLGQFHSRLRDFVRSLPPARRRGAFVFATSGFADAGFQRFSRPMMTLLEQKGFEVADTFSCRAFDTYLPFKPVGGIRKGRPNAVDLDSARIFAEGLRDRIAAAS